MSRSKRAKLFRRYSRGLENIDPEMRGKFRCPICLQNFTDENINHKLSIAHIFPNSAGCNASTLTCKSCNNRLGYSQDSALAEWCKAHSSQKSDLYISVDDGPAVRSILVTDEKNGRHKIEAIQKANNLIHVQQQTDYLKKNRTGTINVTFHERAKNYDEKQIKLGLLTGAYLMAFSRLGYSYILSETLNKIRNQILNPIDKIIAGETVAFGKEKWGSYSTIPRLFINETPLANQCFFVTWRNAIIILPKVEDCDLQIYNRLSNFNRKKIFPFPGKTYELTQEQGQDFVLNPYHLDMKFSKNGLTHSFV